MKIISTTHSRSEKIEKNEKKYFIFSVIFSTLNLLNHNFNHFPTTIYIR